MTQLGTIAGDVGRVRYDADSQKRIYLFGGDIREGLTSADVLQLPQQAMPIPGPGGPTSVDISPFDPTKWLSLRAYDVGLCSMVPSQNVHPFEALGWAAIANQFVLRLDRALADQYQAVRTQPATFTPVFRTALDFDPQGDGFRISGTYHAQKIPVTRSLFECDDVTFDIAADVGWSRAPATITFPPSACLPRNRAERSRPRTARRGTSPASCTPSAFRSRHNAPRAGPLRAASSPSSVVCSCTRSIR